MQSSRDSSVLRSLAIAFGDGLAFGVGMKLSAQKALGTGSPAPPLPEPELLDRIDQIERRVQQVEKLPAAIAAGAPGQPIDQKVLEAVVGALDARLAEQTTATERRLRDLEAKLTIELKTLHQQDHSVATGLQDRIAELHEQFSGQVGEIRQKTEGAHIAYRTELAALHRQFALETAKAVEAGLASKETQFQQRANSLHAALEEHTRTAQARHQALEAGVGSRIEGLRAGLAAETARIIQESLAENRVSLSQRFDAISGRIDETRAAASADAAKLIDEAMARNNAEVANQLADLHATLDEHARAAASREAALSARLETRIALMQGEFAAIAARLIDERVAKAVEAQITPLRAEIDAKDRELQSLRAKLAESDRHAANLFLAIGQACREAAERIAPSAVAPDPVKADPPEPPPSETSVSASGSDEGLPGFAQSKPPGKLLRIPLVSSMAMAIAASAALLHFL